MSENSVENAFSCMLFYTCKVHMFLVNFWCMIKYSWVTLELSLLLIAFYRPLVAPN